MSTKQDRVAPRTAEDIERKYGFGKKFSEIIGLIDDARDEVDATASELRDEITNQSTAISRNTEQIVMEATKTTERFEDIDGSLSTLNSKVSQQLTADGLSLAIKNELINGVNSVNTTTGYTFNDKGLTISKTGSGLKTQITEEGMKVVSSSGSDLLTANHQGVDAVDLKASTFLIIGGKSRFENYGNRTACFWVGG